MPLTATGPEVCVTTTNTAIYYSYVSLEKTLYHLRILKLKDHLVDNVVYLSAEILVYTENLESIGSFNPKHLIHITRIFENTSDIRLLRSLLRNSLCVIRMSYDLQI